MMPNVNLGLFYTHKKSPYFHPVPGKNSPWSPFPCLPLIPVLCLVNIKTKLKEIFWLSFMRFKGFFVKHKMFSWSLGLMKCSVNLGSLLCQINFLLIFRTLDQQNIYSLSSCFSSEKHLNVNP